MSNTLSTLKQGGEDLRTEVRERSIGYVVAAFGFVAGLAWNEAIKALIEYLFPLSTNTLWAKFLYAIVVTLVVVFVTMYLVRLTKRNSRS